MLAIASAGAGAVSRDYSRSHRNPKRKRGRLKELASLTLRVTITHPARRSSGPRIIRVSPGGHAGPRNPPRGRPAGRRAEMCQITAQSSGRISLFFTSGGIDGILRTAPVGRRRRPIFFAANHLGRDSRLTSVGVEETKSRRAGCTGLVWPTLPGTKSFPPGHFWQKVLSFRRVVARSPFFQAIGGTTSVFRGDSWPSTPCSLPYPASSPRPRGEEARKRSGAP